MTDPTSLNRLVASEIRAWAARRQISGRQLAAIIDKTQTWTSTRMRGEQEITLNDLQLFADALEVPITALLPMPARTPKGGSLHLTSTAKPPTRTDQVRPGHATPTLTKPPSTHSIARPSEQPATTGHNRRPVRLSNATTDGGDL